MESDISSVILTQLKKEKPLKTLVFISCCYYDNSYQTTATMYDQPVEVVKKWVKEIKYDIQNSYGVTYSDIPEYHTNIDVLYEFTEKQGD